MIKPTLVLLGAVALFGCASNPSTSQVKNPEPAEKQLVAEDTTDTASRLVCKREKPIGSKRIVKTCRTRDEWDDQARRTQSAMMGNMGGSGGCVDCGGGDGGG